MLANSKGSNYSQANTQGKIFKVAILQPGYLPWLGFFEQMDRVDLFVYLDDVQYTKADWRSRNRIRTPSSNGWTWLTVPVVAGLTGRLISEVLIDYRQKWVSRTLNLVQQNYSKAPFFSEYFPKFAEILKSGLVRLIDLDLKLTTLLADSFGIKTPTVFSSAYSASGRKTEKLLSICLAANASVLYDGESSRNFLDENLLNSNAIRVCYQKYHPVAYLQQFEPFVPFLSALDLLFNMGPDGIQTIRAGGQVIDKLQ